MFNILKNSFDITNKYIILATPLILFSLISSLYLIFSINGNSAGVAFAVILFFLMLGAFLSGWLYMAKKCIINPENDDINGLLAEFPAGVGEYFIPICGIIIICIVITAIISGLTYIAGTKLIGDIRPLYQGLMNASSSASAIKTYITGLTTDELLKLNAWNLLLFTTAVSSHFVLMFYTPTLFFKTKNPFKALFIGIKDIFCRNFFKNVLLFIFIAMTYTVLSVVSTLGGTNIAIHFIMTLINFYYIVFVVIFVFNYYYKNYIQIGSNIDKMV